MSAKTAQVRVMAMWLRRLALLSVVASAGLQLLVAGPASARQQNCKQAKRFRSCTPPQPRVTRQNVDNPIPLELCAASQEPGEYGSN